MPETPKLMAEWFWIDRWVGSSAFLLPLEARGLYREMLTQAWRRGGHLPNDPETIRRAVGCTLAEWKRCWPKVASYWQVTRGVTGELLTNETQASVIARALAVHASAVARGRKGAEQKEQKRLAKLHAKRKPNSKPSSQPSVSSAQAEGLASNSVSKESVVKEQLQTGGAVEDDHAPDGKELHAFLARFCELYAKYRHGAKYLVNRKRDVPLARRLLQVYPRERLEKLVIILLSTDQDWVTQTDRGISILSTKASWLDGLLAEFEAHKRQEAS